MRKKKNIYQKQGVNEKMQKTRKKPEESKKAGRKKEKGRTQARNILTGMKSKKARYKLNEKLLSRKRKGAKRLRNTSRRNQEKVLEDQK